MKSRKQQILFIVLLIFVMTQSGCALLQIPAQIIGGTFQLVGKILDIVGKFPKPPPGVF